MGSAACVPVDMSAENLQDALQKLEEGDLEKLTQALANVKPEDIAKIKRAIAKAEGAEAAPEETTRSEADIKYINETGIEDTLDGCFRCAVKMKPADLNKFAIDYFAGELEKQKRLVLISSNAPEPEVLKGAVRTAGDMGAPIVTAIWDFDGAAETFVKQIKDLVAKHGAFKTIALCCHGKDETEPDEAKQDMWKILGNCAVHVAKDGTSDKGAEDVLQAIADAVTVRIDILACSLAGSVAGMEWMDAWEKKIGKNVAASTNITGNPEKGGDWILETDGIDVARVYFKQEEIEQYSGTFRPKKWCRNLAAGRAARARVETLQALRDQQTP